MFVFDPSCSAFNRGDGQGPRDYRAKILETIDLGHLELLWACEGLRNPGNGMMRDVLTCFGTMDILHAVAGMLLRHPLLYTRPMTQKMV
jgi:hypothetical protein